VCPMSDLFDKRWLHEILIELNSAECLRYSELMRRLVGVSPKTLAERLRQLEGLSIVDRLAYAEVPPRVEYRLTVRGRELAGIVQETCDWAKKWYPVGTV